MLASLVRCLTSQEHLPYAIRRGSASGIQRVKRTVRTHAIVEPVSRCTDENCPVVGVIAIAVFIEEITGLFSVVGLGVGQGLKKP